MQIFLEALIMRAFFQKIAANRAVLNLRVTALDSGGKHKISRLAGRHSASVRAATAAELIPGVIAVAAHPFDNVEKTFFAHNLPKNLSAVLSARAMIVSAGLTESALGKIELS